METAGIVLRKGIEGRGNGGVKSVSKVTISVELRLVSCKSHPSSQLQPLLQPDEGLFVSSSNSYHLLLLKQILRDLEY